MITILNAIILSLGTILQAIIILLPESPFNFVYNIDNEFIQNINYILPLPQVVAHLTLILQAIIIYYGLRIALKWIKAAAN